MYKEVRPHKKFKAASGTEFKPVKTLKEDTGRLCHIIIDDGCYVSYLDMGDLGFIHVIHIFPELHKALITLEPLPETL